MLRLVQQASVLSGWDKNEPAVTIQHVDDEDVASIIPRSTTTTTTTTTVNKLQEPILHAGHFSNNSLNTTARRLLSQSQASQRLISSPYPDVSNQLDLSTLPLNSQLLALALTVLEPIRPDYATAPYLSSFNWSRVFALLRELCSEAKHVWPAQKFYVVIFRSQLQPAIDRDRLGLLDQKSHEEACQSGGLLKYWFGVPNYDRRNLATCLWHSYGDAVDGGKGPWHAQARLAAREMYDSITFHTHQLSIGEGAREWSLEEFERTR